MIEEFKDVPDFPGYRISNFGYVQSCWKVGRSPEMIKNQWRDLRSTNRTERYDQVNLTKRDGSRKVMKVHSLVASIFLKKPKTSKKLCVRHLDGNSKNNRVDNLAYGTYKENEADKKIHGRDYKSKIFTKEDIIYIRSLPKTKENREMLSMKYGVTTHHIYAIISKRRHNCV